MWEVWTKREGFEGAFLTKEEAEQYAATLLSAFGERAEVREAKK